MAINAWGFYVATVNGHNQDEIMDALRIDTGNHYVFGATPEWIGIQNYPV